MDHTQNMHPALNFSYDVIPIARFLRTSWADILPATREHFILAIVTNLKGDQALRGAIAAQLPAPTLLGHAHQHNVATTVVSHAGPGGQIDVTTGAVVDHVTEAHFLLELRNIENALTLIKLTRND